MVVLLALGMATWVTWEWVLTVIPVRLPPWIQTPLVAGVAYGLSRCSEVMVVHALAATAVAAILHTFIQGERPTPVQLRRRPGTTAVVPDLP